MKRMPCLATFALAAAVVSGGCVSMMPPEPTPLELLMLQSREYEEDKQVLFSSVMTVFQDMGYTPTSADLETGFISAESAAQGGFNILDLLVDDTTVVQTRATAYIERIGEGTRVRLSFVEVRSTSSVAGQTDRRDVQVLDPMVYQNAFERIEQAIFVRSAN
ncbi:MAG: hypothetical protein OXH09_09680 [Gammaproteobacteria bacterium]|nr:hypothetical protein [Gammaproteobacteria bacterium]